MIDVSYQSVKSGLVNLLCTRIKTVLADLPRYCYLLQYLFAFLPLLNCILCDTEFIINASWFRSGLIQLAVTSCVASQFARDTE